MAHAPLLTFRAGKCDFDNSVTPPKIKPDKTKGYIYLYTGEDDLMHFCWRPRTRPASDPDNLDLVMFPDDSSFVPYTGRENAASSDELRSPTNGRIFSLRFKSSSQRYLFWLQAHDKAANGDHSHFDAREQKLGQLVDALLSGEELSLDDEIAELKSYGARANETEDEDEDMQDADNSATATGTRQPSQGSGGAGAGATGGDVRDEGSEAREGGADGGRANSAANITDPSAVVQNFLNSLKSGGGMPQQQQQQQQDEKRFTTLPHLLSTTNTIPFLDVAPEDTLDKLLAQLPPSVLMQDGVDTELDNSTAEPDADEIEALIMSLETDRKRSILRRVLRSPQLHQSLAVLTQAIRDGGLPSIGDALQLNVPNGGMIAGGTMPVAGEGAMRAFVDGVKATVEKRTMEGEGDDAPQGGDSMETD